MSQPRTLIETELQHTSSGTSVEPESTPVAMLMAQRAGWTLMLHGVAFLTDTQQHAGSQRGGDKLFSTNWMMPMAQHRAGSRGRLTLRTMLSFEPATVSGRFYPELFQQGETAYGRPIVDGQHPHDFVMELAALYDLRVGEHSLFSVYAAPVGDPAIGPTAYPHRESASEDPIAALGHHQEDSTHIAFNVVTAGWTYRQVRVEGSGFHGQEPGEARWSLEPSGNGHAIDSGSMRLTWAPTANASAQYSFAQIASPEALAPGVNQRRQTASLMLNQPLGRHADMGSMPGMDMGTPAWGNLAATLLWGQTRSSTDGALANSYLLEMLLRLRKNFVSTRVEYAARTSELNLFARPAPAAETPAGHVQAYTVGYGREAKGASRLRVAAGAQLTVYRAPDVLAASYGRVPLAGTVFVRLRLGSAR